MNNMADDPESFAEAQGVVLGRLRARLPDHTVVGDLVLLLTGGTRCNYPIGTVLRVTYAERDGMKEASRVVRTEW
jgi:hypothetical protein